MTDGGRRLVGIAVALGWSTVVAFGAPAERKSGSILPGGNSKQPINIAAAKLDYFDKEQKLIYTGSVVATQGDSTLKASVLTIFLVPKTGDGAAAGGSSTGRVQRMLAVGPVTLLQRDQVGTGDNGVYDKAANTVVLTGNVILTQGGDVSKGDKLVYDLKTGQAVVSGGRVSSMFLPSGGGDAKENDEPPRRGTGRKGAATSGSRVSSAGSR